MRGPMRSDRALASFIDYCHNHPQQRFWQALRNWSKYDTILGVDGSWFDLTEGIPERDLVNFHDTFDLEDLEGTRERTIYGTLV
jgi:hypothetical protein